MGTTNEGEDKFLAKIIEEAIKKANGTGAETSKEQGIDIHLTVKRTAKNCWQVCVFGICVQHCS